MYIEIKALDWMRMKILLLHWVIIGGLRSVALGNLRCLFGDKPVTDRDEAELNFQLRKKTSVQTSRDNTAQRSIKAGAVLFHTFILRTIKALRLCKRQIHMPMSVYI